MEPDHRQSAERMRSQLASGWSCPPDFNAALRRVPPEQRDEWVDCVLGLRELPDDGAELPQGCAPYLPCPVDALLRIVEHAPVRASDTFVDVGSGVGRASAFVNLLTGAGAIGIEVQPRLVRSARDLAARLPGARIASVEGDAPNLIGFITIGSVFLLYCPFGGERLEKVLSNLEEIARTRVIRVCCVNLPLPTCPWLELEHSLEGDLCIYRSTPVRHGSWVVGRGTCGTEDLR